MSLSIIGYDFVLCWISVSQFWKRATSMLITLNPHLWQALFCVDIYPHFGKKNYRKHFNRTISFYFYDLLNEVLDYRGAIKITHQQPPVWEWGYNPNYVKNYLRLP